MPDEPIVDHADAWDLAHFRAPHSNIARSYIELRQTLNAFLGGDERALERLKNIDAAQGIVSSKPLLGR